MKDHTYGSIVRDISDAFNRYLEMMSAEYNFDHGDEFEIAVCETLRCVLPRKYGVCRGFVIDKQGAFAGDDIIIYDADSFPDLRFSGDRVGLARKARIPVDAVYAYIEAKHNLTPDTLSKAVAQVIRVKRLCYTRNHVLHEDAKSYAEGELKKEGLHIFDNDYSRDNGWNPIVTTPVYGMILSRYCSPSSRGHAQTGKDVADFIVHFANDNMSQLIADGGMHCPESIVIGNYANALCGHYLFGADGNLEQGIQITRFYTGVKPFACYQVNAHEESSFGIAIAHMLCSLDYIHLGKMPWAEILNTAKIPDRETRNQFLMSLSTNLLRNSLHVD